MSAKPLERGLRGILISLCKSPSPVEFECPEQHFAHDDRDLIISISKGHCHIRTENVQKETLSPPKSPKSDEEHSKKNDSTSQNNSPSEYNNQPKSSPKNSETSEDLQGETNTSDKESQGNSQAIEHIRNVQKDINNAISGIGTQNSNTSNSTNDDSNNSNESNQDSQKESTEQTNELINPAINVLQEKGQFLDENDYTNEERQENEENQISIIDSTISDNCPDDLRSKLTQLYDFIKSSVAQVYDTPVSSLSLYFSYAEKESDNDKKNSEQVENSKGSQENSFESDHSNNDPSKGEKTEQNQEKTQEKSEETKESLESQEKTQENSEKTQENSEETNSNNYSLTLLPTSTVFTSGGTIYSTDLENDIEGRFSEYYSNLSCKTFDKEICACNKSDCGPPEYQVFRSHYFLSEVMKEFPNDDPSKLRHLVILRTDKKDPVINVCMRCAHLISAANYIALASKDKPPILDTLPPTAFQPIVPAELFAKSRYPVGINSEMFHPYHFAINVINSPYRASLPPPKRRIPNSPKIKSPSPKHSRKNRRSSPPAKTEKIENREKDTFSISQPLKRPKTAIVTLPKFQTKINSNQAKMSGLYGKSPVNIHILDPKRKKKSINHDVEFYSRFDPSVLC